MAKRVGFNYESVTDKVQAAKALENAKQIRALLEQSAVSVVQIGRLMAEVKVGLTPTLFVAWVDAEFGWVESVASNYMQAARVFGDLDCLKQFQPSAICMLARKNVPESAVKEAIKRARAGEVISYSLVHKLLKAAGHKPTNGSANKFRKPMLRPIPAARATFSQVQESVESLASLLGSLAIEQAERESLATRFFEMAMTLRLGPAQPAAAVETPTPQAKASPRGKKSTPAAPANDLPAAPIAQATEAPPRAERKAPKAKQAPVAVAEVKPTASPKDTNPEDRVVRPSYSRAKPPKADTPNVPASGRSRKRELATT